MLGWIITILGIVTTFRLWDNLLWLAIVVGIITLYQASSLNEMRKEMAFMQMEDKWQARINIISSFIIIALFIFSFII